MQGTRAWLRRAVVAIVVTSVAVFGAGQAANAAVDSHVSAVSAASAAVTGATYEVMWTADNRILVRPASLGVGTDDAGIQATWTHKFSQATTQRLYDLAKAGALGAMDLICQAYAPLWLDPLCHFVTLALIAFFQVGAPNGRCLQISVTTKLGWPPVRVSIGYVTC
ncbi:MAG TPA: hypothetical protein VFC00_36145 [Micromonosporaceae bacterium]|nr:hypothetical protein [Micromonosporaceae bacterium]